MLCESQSWSSHALCILHCLASGLLNFGRGDWYRVEVARHENQLQNTMANFFCLSNYHENIFSEEVIVFLFSQGILLCKFSCPTSYTYLPF